MPELVQHRLSFVIRFNDHFTGAAVPDELPVRLDRSFRRPTAAPGGGKYRQPDGTYRFVGLAGGPVRILWREPFALAHRGWTRWEDDPEIDLPLADAANLQLFDLWPTADAPAPAAATGVRGKLTGPDAAGQIVRIALTGGPFPKRTRSDEFGNFLFLPPGPLPVDNTGRIPLSIRITRPDDTARAVTGGTFLPPSPDTPPFAGTDFTILPRTVPRILFQLA